MAAVAIPAERYTLTLASNDPLMHQSLLSSVTAKIHSSTGSQLHLQLMMAFKQRALKHLRHLLSQSGSEGVKIAHCYAISMLIWTEVGKPNIVSNAMADLPLYSVLVVNHQTCKPTSLVYKA